MPGCTPGARWSTSTCRPIPYDGPGLARALNRQLAPEVVVRRADEVGPDFDARRSATGRTYRYLVWNAPAPDPLLAPVAWHVRDPLDLVAMRTASDVLLGSHDFRSFCRRRPGTDASEPIVRRVTMARWSVDDGPEATDADRAGRRPALLRFDIAASSFCHQMVRSLVGQPRRGGPGPAERRRPHGAPAGGRRARAGPSRHRRRACAWFRWPTGPAGGRADGPVAGPAA